LFTYAAILVACSFRIFIAIIAYFNLKIKQFDVINAFANANRLVWRGEPPKVDFYAFWRVRLALHVTVKGIYIPGFCTYHF